jgi:hypothetical protein
MKAPLVKRRASFAFVLFGLFSRHTIRWAWRSLLFRRNRFRLEDEKRMLFIAAIYPQRGRRSRARVLCAPRSERSPLTAAAAEVCDFSRVRRFPGRVLLFSLSGQRTRRTMCLRCSQPQDAAVTHTTTTQFVFNVGGQRFPQ